MDGKSVDEILGKGIGYTYNDINILPRHIQCGINDIQL